MLRVASHGVCCGHLVLPLGQEAANATVIIAGIGDAAAQWKKSTGRGPLLGKPILASIAGQCDLSVSINTDDFRFAYELQSALVNTSAEASTWIFSVPFETPHEETDDSYPLGFVTYLRVLRAAYRSLGARLDEAIVAEIRRLLAEEKGKVAADVRYTLGWPDLAVQGSSRAPVKRLLSLLLRLESLRVPGPRGAAFPVFQRAITLAGVARGATCKGPRVKPLVLLRAAPGRLPDAIMAAGGLFEGRRFASFILDGKWDGAVLPRHPIEVTRYLRHRTQSLRKLRKAGIERTETHLLASSAAARATFADPVPDVLQVPAIDIEKHACRCTGPDALPQLEPLLKRLETTDVLPHALRTTVTSCLALFRFALQDSANCCDLLLPLRACVQGLDRLLHKAEDVAVLVAKAAPQSQSEWFDLLQRYRQDIRNWCRTSRRVLSERTAGSFEALFKRSYSVTSYRGGMQKSLLIADGLAHVFHDSLPAALRQDDRDARPLVTVFKSGGTITDVRLTGVIQIPLRYAFSLQLVLPQIWHETAQLVFQQQYSPPTPDAQRLDDDLRVLDERLLATMGPKSPSLWQSKNDLFEQLGDAYSDLLVFRYGFQSRLPEHLVYLSTLMLETLRYVSRGSAESCPPVVEFRHWQMLLLRLCFVAQSSSLLQELDTLPKTEKLFRAAMVERRAELRADSMGRLAHRLLEKVDELVLQKTRYRGRGAPRGVAANVARHLASAVFNDIFLGRIDDLGWQLRAEGHSPRTRSTLPPELPDGSVIDEEDPTRISDWYCAAYGEEVQRLLNTRRKAPGYAATSPQFRFLAALGRTAVLTFQRT